MSFLCLLCAWLPNLNTLEWIDQQHFAKTKMGYISLPSNLNAIIGITSCYCVSLKMVTLHDAIKTIKNVVFVFFWKKNKKLFLFKKNKKSNGKSRWIVFLKNGYCSTLMVFQSFLWFSLDRTIWNKSRHYQFGWVCAAHLECGSLVMKKLRINGIWIRKN